MKKKDQQERESSANLEVQGSERVIAEALASLEKKEDGQASTNLDQFKSLLEKKDALIKEAHDRLLRLSADYDNFKKRGRKDQELAISRGKEQFIREFLPILDSFERTLEHAPSTQESQAMIEGIRLIHRQIQNYLQQNGVVAVESVGKTFDPKFHEAISQQPSPEHEHLQIIAERQRGYLFQDRLLRPSQVIVAFNPKEEENLSQNMPPTPIKC